jgi:CubicO group peptidase (beta-lactamase class C family)
LPDYQDLWPSYGAPLRDKEVYELIKKHDQNRFFPGSDVCLNSDTAFAVLALVIEQVSGMSYQEYMAENIFKPLGMNIRWPLLTVITLFPKGLTAPFGEMIVM